MENPHLHDTNFETDQEDEHLQEKHLLGRITQITQHHHHHHHPSPHTHFRRHRRNRSVLLNLGISATFLAISSLLLQIIPESVAVMALPPSSTFPSSSSTSRATTTDGVYSLFPHEDLRTGKKIRFEDDPLNRDRSSTSHRDRYGSSYPVIFDDRYNNPRPGGGSYSVRGSAVGLDNHYRPSVYPSQYEQDRNYLDSLRTRGSRVYFDDDRGRFPSPFDSQRDIFRDDRSYYPGGNRPTLIQRPISPVGSFHPIQRPNYGSYLPEVSPGPSLSKLPVGATLGSRNYDRDGPYRIHVFNPNSDSYGNPRNAGRYNSVVGGGSRGGFSETGGPGPDLFINHEQYLEYHRKVAIARDEEFRKLQKALENKGGQNSVPDTKQILFASKQPFDIGGLSPPPRSLEQTTSGPSTNNNDDLAAANGGPNLSQPVVEESLAGNHHRNDPGNTGQVSLFTGSDARVAFTAGTVESQAGSNGNHGRVIHVPHHGNDPGGVLSTTTKTGKSESTWNNNNKGVGEEDKGARGGGSSGSGTLLKTTTNKEQNVELVEESENAKSQVTQIPPNFISKSGRQLAYHHHEQPNIHQVGKSTNSNNDYSIGGGVGGSTSTSKSTTTTMKSSVSSYSTTSSSAASTSARSVVSLSNKDNVGSGSGSSKNNQNKPINNDQQGDKLVGNNGKNNNEADGTDFALHNGRKAPSGTTKNDVSFNKTSISLGSIGQALPLVQQNINADAFFRPSQPEFQIPEGGGNSIGRDTVMLIPVSKSKAEKSGLGTEMTKSRIKSNAATKVAIIRQQELKKMQKERPKTTSTTVSSLDDDEEVFLKPLSGQSIDKLTKKKLLASKVTERDIRKLKYASLSNIGRPAHKSEFKIPVLPKPKQNNYKDSGLTGKSTIEIDAVAELLKDHRDPFRKRDSILGNNDLINNRLEGAGVNDSQEDGHFTLINLHNDEVNIVQDSDGDNDNGHERQIESPPLSQTYSSSPSFSSNLDHGDDSLLLLESQNDALVNKTLDRTGGSDRRMSKINSSTSSPTTAASTNFIKVVRVKNPLSSSSVIPIPTTSSSTNINNLNLPLFIQKQLPFLLSQQKLPLNNETANYVAAALIAAASINNNNGMGSKNDVSTAHKTLSLFLAKRLKTHEHVADNTKAEKSVSNSAAANIAATRSYVKASNVASSSFNRHITKESWRGYNRNFNAKSVAIDARSENKIGNGSDDQQQDPLTESSTTAKSTHGGGVARPRGVVSKVHAHVSNCPKLKAPAEIICDIHIRERHDHPNPQLTVGWRRKYYNSTQPDVLLVLNKTQAYESDESEEEDDGPDDGELKGWANIDIRNSSDVISATRSVRNGPLTAKGGDASLEDFHDKFNVTLAPGISPMLRSVLLIRGVTAPDCGNYQCEVYDGIHTLTSETLLFLCH